MKFKKEELEKALRIVEKACKSLEKVNNLLGDIEDQLVKAGVSLADPTISELTPIGEAIDNALSRLYKLGTMIAYYSKGVKEERYSIRRWI